MIVSPIDLLGNFVDWSVGKSWSWFGKVTNKSSTAFPLSMHFFNCEDLVQYLHWNELLISFWHKFHINTFFWFAGEYTMKMLIKKTYFISPCRRNSAQSSGVLYTLSLILFLPVSFLQSPYLNVFTYEAYSLNLWYFCHLTI